MPTNIDVYMRWHADEQPDDHTRRNSMDQGSQSRARLGLPHAATFEAEALTITPNQRRNCTAIGATREGL